MNIDDTVVDGQRGIYIYEKRHILPNKITIIELLDGCSQEWKDFWNDKVTICETTFGDVTIPINDTTFGIESNIRLKRGIKSPLYMSIEGYPEAHAEYLEAIKDKILFPNMPMSFMLKWAQARAIQDGLLDWKVKIGDEARLHVWQAAISNTVIWSHLKEAYLKNKAWS